MAALGLLLAVCVQILMADCPFNRALHNGEIRARIVEDTKQQLISEQYLLSSDQVGVFFVFILKRFLCGLSYCICALQPGNLIWGTDPQSDELVDLFNRSNAMVMAKQFYIQQFMVDHPGVNVTATIRAELLREVEQNLPMYARCTEEPSCDDVDDR